MKNTTVSIAEGKKNFSHLCRDAFENKKEIIVTKRGRPVAVIIPYDKYERSRRVEAFVFEESRKELERKI